MRNHYSAGQGGRERPVLLEPTLLERTGIFRVVEVLRSQSESAIPTTDGLVGIGIQFRPTEQNCYVVAGVTPGGAAEDGGVLVGDFIHSVDGVNARGLSTAELIRKIQGKPDTILTLSLEASRAVGRDSPPFDRPHSRSSQHSFISSTREGKSLPSPRKYDLHVTGRESPSHPHLHSNPDLGFRFAQLQDGSFALDATIEGTPARDLVKRGKTALGHTLLFIDHESVSGLDLQAVHSLLQAPPGTLLTLTMEASHGYSVTTSDVRELNRSLYSSREGSLYAASWPSSRHSSPERTLNMTGRPCVKVCVVDASGIKGGEAARRYYCCVSVLSLHALESGAAAAAAAELEEEALGRQVAHAGRSSDRDAGALKHRRVLRPQRRTRGVPAAPRPEWERLFSLYDALAVSTHGGRVVSNAEEVAEEREALVGQPVQLLVSVHEQEKGGRGACLGQALMPLHMGGIEDRRLRLHRAGTVREDGGGGVVLHLSCTYSLEEGLVRRPSFFQEMLIQRQHQHQNVLDDDDEEEEDPGSRSSGERWQQPLNARFDALASRPSPPPVNPSPPASHAPSRRRLAEPSAGGEASAGGAVSAGRPAPAARAAPSGTPDLPASHLPSAPSTQAQVGGDRAEQGHGSGMLEGREGGAGARSGAGATGLLDSARFPFNGAQERRSAALGSEASAKLRRGGEGEEDADQEKRTALRRHGWQVGERVGGLEVVVGRVERAMRGVQAREGEQEVLRRQLHTLQGRAFKDAVKLERALHRMQQLEAIVAQHGLLPPHSSEPHPPAAQAKSGARREGEELSKEEVARLQEGLSEQRQSNERLSGELEASVAEASLLRDHLTNLEELVGARGGKAGAMEMRSMLRVERENNEFLGQSLRELSARHAQQTEDLLANLSHKDQQVAELSRTVLEKEEEARRGRVEVRRLRAQLAALPAVEELPERPAAPHVILRDGHYEELWEPLPAQPRPRRSPSSGPTAASSPSVLHPAKSAAHRPVRAPSSSQSSNRVSHPETNQGAVKARRRRGEEGEGAREEGQAASEVPRRAGRTSEAMSGEVLEGDGGGVQWEAVVDGRGEREATRVELASAEHRSEVLRRQLISAIDSAEGFLTSLPFTP